MLYEQTLDLDTFQSFLNENTDHDPRFYDEFFNLATSQEWKSSNRLPGLPTPPVTPNNEKTRFPWNFTASNHHASNSQIPSHMYGHRDRQSNQSNDYSQVVPDVMHEERNDYNVVPWFHESHKSEVDIRKHVNVSTSREVPYTESPYSNFTNLEDQLRSTSKNFTRTHLNLQAMENVIPDCIGSPDGPSKGMKRNYFNSYCSDMAMTEAGLRSCEENYFRQLAYEKARANQKINIIEPSLAEPELSKATHNVLERQRRNDLKLRFNILRDNIPEIINNDKVAKITILKKACEYIEQLKAQEQKILVDLELEKQRKIILLTRLKQLRGTYL